MTRRGVFRALLAFAACGRVFANTGTVLVVVRISPGNSQLCTVEGGVIVARVRITVLNPEIMNDVGCAQGIREGLKAWGDDLPLFLLEAGRVSRVT